MWLIQRYCFLIILIHKIFGLDIIPGPHHQNYVIKNKVLGSGTYGVVYEGYIEGTGEVVAIKKGKNSFAQSERMKYDEIGKHIGIPRIYHSGRFKGEEFMVMERLGPSLEDFLKKSKKGYFSPRNVAVFAKQMIRLVKYIHSRDLLYVDIKPNNFVVGATLALRDSLYALDFGSATRYKIDGRHVVMIRRQGTAHFESINGRKNNISRRDDMESLGYTLLYLLRGSLPWTKNMFLLKNARNAFNAVYDLKERTPISELLKTKHGNLPQQFGTIFQYSRDLDFFDEPDYNHYDSLMNQVLANLGLNEDCGIDWPQLAAKSFSCGR